MSPPSLNHLAALLRRVATGLCAALCLSIAPLLALPAAAADSAPLRLAQDDVRAPTVTPQILRQDQLRMLQVPAQRTVQVPDLSGMTFGEAQSLVSGLGLNLRANEFQDTTAPRFRIARQSPGPGTQVPLKSWIVVDTEPWTQVPQLTGRPPQEAQRLAARVGLDAQVARSLEADVAAPVVQRQEPEPGTWVREKSRVALVVARPRALVEVPDVMGWSSEAAQREILAAKLVPLAVPGATGDVKEPTVAHQDPPGGAQAEPGSLVRLRILQPPAAPPPEPQPRQPEPQQPDLVEVPGLIGHSPAEAEALLKPPGLVLGQGRLLDGEAGSSERIVAQQPSPGTLVEPGSRVIVDIEVPPPMGRVPSIVGMTLGEAIGAVKGGGFSFESQGPAQLDPTRDKVVAQDPAGDTMAPFGAKVTARVARALVTVPAIVGRTVAEARALVEDADLRFGPRGLRRLDPDGQLIATQEPDAGAEVPAGTLVVATPEPALPPRKPLVAVPELRELSLAEARSAVTDAGLALAREAQSGPTRDRIARQEPGPEALVPPGTRVRVWLAAATATVPDLSGLSWDQAAQALRDADLRPAEPAPDEASDPTAIVALQQPEAGSEVPLRSVVTVALLPQAIQPQAGGGTPAEPAPEGPPEATPEPAPEPTPVAEEPPEQPLEPPVDGGGRMIPVMPPQPEPQPVLLVLTARDLWWAAGGAGLVLFLLAGWLLARPRGAHGTAPAKPPAVSVKVERDPGAQQITWDSEPALRCRLSLRTVADRGSQQVVTERDSKPQAVRRYG